MLNFDHLFYLSIRFFFFIFVFNLSINKIALTTDFNVLFLLFFLFATLKKIF